MLPYSHLLRLAEQHEVYVFEALMEPRNKGLYGEGAICINQSMSQTEKQCILAEELGHHFMTVGDILDQSKLDNRKQERRARVWAHEYLIPLTQIVQAHRDGICNRHELAEYLGVTEAFLHEGIERYKEKYGMLVRVGDVHLCLDPLGVIEMFDFPI